MIERRLEWRLRQLPGWVLLKLRELPPSALDMVTNLHGDVVEAIDLELKRRQQTN